MGIALPPSRTKHAEESKEKKSSHINIWLYWNCKIAHSCNSHFKHIGSVCVCLCVCSCGKIVRFSIVLSNHTVVSRIYVNNNGFLRLTKNRMEHHVSVCVVDSKVCRCVYVQIFDTHWNVWMRVESSYQRRALCVH